MSAKKLCVIFGNPIQHSKSPDLQHQFAREAGVDLEYLRVCAPLDNLKGALDEWRKKGICGANITVPFKEEIMQYCDTLTEEAKRAKAVNTIRIESDGSIIGHNTDGVGLISDITEAKKYAIEGKRVLLLGAGGAARGILKPLLDQKPHSVVITNRTLSRAEGLAEEFQKYGTISAKAWKEIDTPFDLIINATSASLEGEFPALHSAVITESSVGFDLMYGDKPTVFMEYFLERGGDRVYDGLGMLIEQGVFAFEFWFNLRPSTEGAYALFGRKLC